jgi:hypothetical protein
MDGGRGYGKYHPFDPWEQSATGIGYIDGSPFQDDIKLPHRNSGRSPE